MQHSQGPRVEICAKLFAAGGTIFWSMLAIAVFLGSAAMTPGGSPVDVPSISAGVGPCTADFTVVDASNKPVYDAKIHVKVKSGFMSKHDTDLEIGTNSDGKAHFEGLPDKLKKPPMEFTVKSGDNSKSVTNDPAVNCHATLDVALGK
ncbi:MAG TPA: hypothetical protein VMO17_00235 [Terriglobia bacterium]|nr:hypothetical protein [Terriglobia bacterium]